MKMKIKNEIFGKIGDEYMKHMEKYFLQKFAKTVLDADFDGEDAKIKAASRAAFKIFVLGLNAQEKEIIMKAIEEIERSRRPKICF